MINSIGLKGLISSIFSKKNFVIPSLIFQIIIFSSWGNNGHFSQEYIHDLSQTSTTLQFELDGEVNEKDNLNLLNAIQSFNKLFNEFLKLDENKALLTSALGHPD